jgi:MoaA/NifB/PqqE/SkfB family radical SAM enzyme
MNTDKSDMSLEDFKLVIDKIYKKTYHLVLYGYGEPFLHPDFLEMLKYAKSKNMFVITHSNLNTVLPADELVNLGVDTIHMSIDGITQETYEKYRVNGSLPLVISNIKNIIKAREKLHKTTPKLLWQFIVFEHNKHEIDDLKKLVKELGVDELQLGKSHTSSLFENILAD